jgi:two-component system, cell cycle sensor histidine kinase and response regulator CckA
MPEATLSASSLATADQALRASEIRYRRLFEAARDGILILDAGSGEITAVNPFLADLLGYSTDDILGKKLWELGPFQDIKKGKIAFKELQSQEYIRYDDLPLETSDGRSIDVEFVSNMYLSDHQQVIQCNIRDITARKRVEQTLRAGDQRYLALFEYAPDGILIADCQSRYIDANPSMCCMLGYSRDELIGLHASDIVAPAEVAHIDPALALIAQTSEYHREWQFRRKDGSLFRADVIVTAMPDGNLLAMIRDVTERNQAEATLRRSEERVQFALQNANIGIWDMDYVSGVLQWSDVMETQYGLPPGTFGGTYEAFVERIHPEDRAAVIEVIENATQSGSDFNVVHRTVRPDGTVRWLSGAGRTLLDERGEPLRGVGISQDVTERHTLEAQFQQAQKMEAVGRLAGGVAHDFNNLLTVILGFCELLLAGLSADDPHRVDITEIQKAGTRAARLTSQLLAFSRQEIIEPTLLDLNTILDDIRPMLGRLIKENVRILMGLRPRLGCVKADRGQVEQVLLNLAVNAQDAMPNGGTLTIETANVELDEHYTAMHSSVKPGPYVALTMTDSGSGMSRHVLDHLFEPFFTTKGEGKGTGLGLATVHGIAARSGGSVNVYSEVGRGSSFKVYFPRIVEGAPIVGVPATLPKSSAGTETVLVVEDSDALRELTRRLLSTLGYTVLVAANAVQASKVFDENPSIDVLLTDVVMPGPSGPDLSEQLVKRRPLLKVIYMSGYTDEAIVQHGVLLPGIAFLHKPFTSGALGRKIREVLDS